jgi:hypothetical protein
VNDIDSGVETVDVGFAKVEIRRRRTRVVLRNGMKISNRAGRKTATNTYGSQEDQCLLKITKSGDFARADASRNTSDKGMEVFERLLSEDGLDDVFMNLLTRELA